MGSLWGTKKDDDEEPTQSRNGESSQPEPEADERTRLLPPNHDGYLSPDDPAVSPYNLWSVRILRWFTLFFAIITFLWWVVLFVSIFVSPPGMHSRGSGFFDFSYTTLTLGLLLVVLMFFLYPSRATQILSMFIAVFLLVDMIMILAIPRLRVEEGWVGIASVVWALIISIWTVGTDRAVAWGKTEEEERLTGRVETRRTLVEWLCVLFTTIILVVLSLVAFLLTATLILRAQDATLAPPGERFYVDGDKYQLHLFCKGPTTDQDGENVVTVLFEAGEAPFGQSMIEIAKNGLQNGTIARYCYTDRPGLGWSDNAPSPFSASMHADAVSEALARAGEEGPWILVSAGVGSIYSRVFSSRHGADVKGLLMIDPLHEDLLYRLAKPRVGFYLWIRGVISPLGIDRLSGALFKGRTREDRVHGRSAYQGGKYIKAKLQESLVADSLTKNEVRSSRNIQIKDVPLTLVSSGIELRKDTQWEEKQRDLSHLTHKLLGWDIVNKAPHEVWRTWKGREILEKRLEELVFRAKVTPPTEKLDVDGVAV